MTSTASTPTEDRRLLAEVSRWRKAADWTDSSRGFQNAPFEDGATVAVRPNEAGFQVWRKPADAPHFTGQPTEYPAESVREAIDLLVALRVLPAHFSSAYQAGQDDARSDDWDDYCDYGYPLAGGSKIPPRIDWCGLKRGHSGLHYGGDREEIGFTDASTVRRGGTR
ncbi:hypothetical protein JNW90_08990 [Micromonospora sp. STR1s_5]|nr:hypothetical protein [Micromonospora sp. STR1s_5]